MRLQPGRRQGEAETWNFARNHSLFLYTHVSGIFALQLLRMVDSRLPQLSKTPWAWPRSPYLQRDTTSNYDDNDSKPAHGIRLLLPKSTQQIHPTTTPDISLDRLHITHPRLCYSLPYLLFGHSCNCVSVLYTSRIQGRAYWCVLRCCRRT